MIEYCGSCCSYWSPNPETFKGYCTYFLDKFEDNRFVSEADYFDKECPRYKRIKAYDETEPAQ